MQRQSLWYVAAALVALGKYLPSDTKTPFSASDLARWVPTYPKPGTAMLAINSLVRAEYLALIPENTVRTAFLMPICYWHLTTAGAEAAAAALKADRALNPAAHGDITPDAPVDPLAARLWSLLRIRRALTADEAASVLADAGDDIAAARRQLGALLLAWSRRFPEGLQISKKRIGKFKRYVLLVDLGGTPPSIRVKKAIKA